MSVLIHRCPSCGAPLSLDPNTQSLHCDYCLSNYTIDDIKSTSDSQDNPTPKSNNTDEMNVYNCPSCGATVVTTTTTSATFCYYCHSPVVLTNRLKGEYSPTQIIPFSIDKSKAQELFLSWCKSKKFAPHDFTSQNHIEKIVGIYFPYWLVDNEVSFDYSSQSTKVNVTMVGEIQTTKTSFFEHIRKGSATLVDVSEIGLKNACEDMLNSLYPYNNKEIKPFNISYLSGFLAETYDKTKEDVSQSITNQVNSYTKQLIKGSIPTGTNVTFENLNHNITNQNWDFTLLPTWVLTYKYKGKIYMFGINAQTGKICGEVPIDKRRLSIFTASLSATVFTILGLLGGFFFG